MCTGDMAEGCESRDATLCGGCGIETLLHSVRNNFIRRTGESVGLLKLFRITFCSFHSRKACANSSNDGFIYLI